MAASIALRTDWTPTFRDQRRDQNQSFAVIPDLPPRAHPARSLSPKIDCQARPSTGGRSGRHGGVTDDEVRVLALLLLPYRRRVEAVWRNGAASAATTTRPVNLLTPAQAAERLGCSRVHIYDLIAAGKLRRFNVSAKTGSTKTRVLDTDVDAYIAAAEMPVETFKRDGR
jgi:excisionase family DNA binding protein